MEKKSSTHLSCLLSRLNTSIKVALSCWSAPLCVRVSSFVKDFRKTDDYMGRAFLSLWSLDRLEGKELHLFSHSGKTPYGSIIVDLSIEQVKKNVSLEVRAIG